VDCAVTAEADDVPTALRSGSGSRLTPLLPNEPRIFHHALQASLTAQYLLPALPALETCLLVVRAALDLDLRALQPVKLGKPYPLGQCLEIAKAMYKRLRSVEDASLPSSAAVGLRALRAFQNAGGAFRQVWGDLRGQYFQNAFQVGTLYIDVANDTVTPTKPKVEILPFHEAQFVAIQDFAHFSRVARRYWQHEIYPNHVLPHLAPHCPLIHVSPNGRVTVHEATQYMLAMTRAKAFHPSEAALRLPPMPQVLFDQVCSALQGHAYPLPSTPEQGRQQALHHCRQYRTKRWHQAPKLVDGVIHDVQQVNKQLARWHYNACQKETTMPQARSFPQITIDNFTYNLDTLSPDARAQLQSLQFVDAELSRLQAQIAIFQTARAAYAKALQAALPTAMTGDTLKFG
jgi:hypothetical protein